MCNDFVVVAGVLYNNERPMSLLVQGLVDEGMLVLNYKSQMSTM